MTETANPLPDGAAGRDPDRRWGGRPGTEPGGWTFLTNHARVLAAVAREPEARIRDIAAVCLLTERAVQKILVDLETAGYIARTRVGRRNTYRIAPGTKVRHPADGGREIADLLALLNIPRARTDDRAAQ
ncbi:helix-turn-helix transcriptional regulator [Streptodolium elevatio]|uniref:Helix-turn-helix domain-containing protein n=1 Tax=Streptodolium elevatio TaxID=3157996 RepID=A0ABV3DQE1_9ACTN